MNVPTTIDAGAWLGKHLAEEGGDGDLARAMLAAFAETLMSAEASALRGAGLRERSEERVNVRNGYRVRPWDTRVGTIDLAVPKLSTCGSQTQSARPDPGSTIPELSLSGGFYLTLP